MKEMVLNFIEQVLVKTCQLFKLMIQIMSWITNVISMIVAFILVCAIGYFIVHYSGVYLPSAKPYILLGLISFGAFCFIALATLLIWKPKRFHKIFQ